MKELIITGHPLTLEEVREVARGYRKVALPEPEKGLSLGEEVVEADSADASDSFANAGVAKPRLGAANSRAEFPYNTGLGVYSGLKLEEHDLEKIQVNSLKAQVSGFFDSFLNVGESRAATLFALNDFVAMGLRREITDLLVDFLNLGLSARVARRGLSLAKSRGSLISQLLLPLLGEGKVFFEDQEVESPDALRRVRLKPISFKAAESYKILNSNAVRNAVLAISILDLENISAHLDLTLALHFEVFRLKGWERFSALLAGSGISEKFRSEADISFVEEAKNNQRILINALKSLRDSLEETVVDLSSVTSAVNSFADHSYQRIYSLLKTDGVQRPQGLVYGESNFGFLGLLNLAAEIKAEMESKTDLGEQSLGLQRLLAIELLLLTQSMEFVRPLKSSSKIEAFYSRVRHYIKPLIADRFLEFDLERMLTLVRSGSLLPESKE